MAEPLTQDRRDVDPIRRAVPAGRHSWPTADPGLQLTAAGGALRWSVRYRVDGRQVREQLGDAMVMSLRDAIDAARVAKTKGSRRPRDHGSVEKATGREAIHDGGRHEGGRTVREAIREFVAWKAGPGCRSDATAKTYRSLLRHVERAFGDRLLADVEKEDADAFIRDLFTAGKPKVGANVARAARAMYGWYLRRGTRGLTANPFAGFEAELYQTGIRRQSRDAHLDGLARIFLTAEVALRPEEEDQANAIKFLLL